MNNISPDILQSFDKDFLKELAKLYMYANTPVFLFRQYRKLSETEMLARKYTAQDIERGIRSLLSDLKELYQLLEVYAMIAALSFKNYVQAKPVLEELLITEVEWVPYLVRYILDTMQPENSYIIEYQYKPKTHVQGG